MVPRHKVGSKKQPVGACTRTTAGDAEVGTIGTRSFAEG
jgi:hypothetical protein